MAYYIIEAQGRRSHKSPYEQIININTLTMRQLINTFLQFCITLENDVGVPDKQYYLLKNGLLEALDPALKDKTLTEWLVTLDDSSVPAILDKPLMVNNPVQYTDIWQGGYEVELADIDRSSQTNLPDPAKKDLLITKSVLDMAAMSEYLLVDVNGYMHLSEGSVDGLYAHDGGKSLNIAGTNHAGILSFHNVGKVQQIPIKESMLQPSTISLDYYQGAVIDVGQSLTNKIVLLSLGGYLHVMDDMYSVIGDQTIEVNTRELRFPERIYQSLNYIDLSPLGLEAEDTNESNHYTVASLRSPEVMKAYLTLSQSFIILVDADEFYVQEHFLENSVSPSRFLGRINRRYPLVGPYGKLYDYRISLEGGIYVYAAEALLKSHYMFQTTDWTKQTSIGPVRYGYRPVTRDVGRLLEFGTFK